MGRHKVPFASVLLLVRGQNFRKEFHNLFWNGIELHHTSVDTYDFKTVSEAYDF